MFGKNIKLLREKLGLSQEELAQRMGMHSNTIARWERDEVAPRGTSMWKLAKALNVSAEALLTGEDGVFSHQDMMGLHGITMSNISGGDTLEERQKRSNELLNQLVQEGKVNPNSLEKNGDELFYAGRSGHLYTPAPFKGIAFWGEVLDAADFAAENADTRELSRIEVLLRDAYETILKALNKKSPILNNQPIQINQEGIGRDANVNVNTR